MATPIKGFKSTLDRGPFHKYVAHARIKQRRGDYSIRKDIRENWHTLLCIGCDHQFTLGTCGEDAESEQEVLVSAHVNGWDITDPDTPWCPDCKESAPAKRST